jgi:hypothetical protein
MKKVIVLLSLCCSIKCYSQDYFVNDKCSIEEVVQVDSVSAKDLYTRAKYALTKIFKSAKDVTQLDDKDNNQLVAKGFTYVRMKNPFNPAAGQVRFAFEIQCKDGRYKYLITDCTHESSADYKYAGGNLCQEKPVCGTFFMPKATWMNIKKDFINQMQLVILDLKKEMVSTNANNKENW